LQAGECALQTEELLWWPQGDNSQSSQKGECTIAALFHNNLHEKKQNDRTGGYSENGRDFFPQALLIMK